MALTATLDTINSSPVQVQRPVETPDFLGGLNRLASGVFNALDRADARKESDTRFQWAQEDRARAEEGRVVANEAEKAFNTALTNANSTLSTNRSAVNQGRASQGTLDLNLDAIVTDLNNKYPDRIADIAQYLQGRGFDHYLLRDVKAQLADEDANQAQTRQAEKTAHDAAVRNGVFIENNYSATVAAGLKILEAEASMEASKKLADAVRADRTLSIQERDLALREAAKDSVNSVNKITAVKIGPAYNSMIGLITAAGSDQDKQAKLAELLPMMNVYFETYRANAKMAVAGNGPDAMAAVDKSIDGFKKSFDDIFNGPLSVYQTNQKNIARMQQEWQMDTTKALPLYSQLKSVLGASGVAMIFGGDPTARMNPDLLDKIKKEVEGYSPTLDPEGASVSLNNIVQILKGNAALRDYTPSEAREALPGVTAALKGAEQDIIGGAKDAETLGRYNNGYSAVLNAAIELEGGTSRIDSLSNATVTVASRAARTAMAEMAKTPEFKEQAESLLNASRNTAYHLFELTRNSPAVPKEAMGGAQKIVYSSAAGGYVIQRDEAKLRAQAGLRINPYTGAVGAEAITRPVANDPTLQKTVDTLNANLNHLVATAYSDPDIPKNVTPRQLRDRYVNGTSLNAAEGPVKVTADQQFDKSLESLRSELLGLPAEIIRDSERGQQSSGPLAPASLSSVFKGAAQATGVPQRLIEAVAWQESRFRADAVSPKGAVGMMQLMPGTAKDLGVEDSTDVAQNVNGGATYLKQMLARYNGDIRLALAAYNAGPGAVDKYKGVPPFKETQAYVESVLGKYENG